MSRGDGQGRATLECYVEMIKRNIMVDSNSRGTVDAVSGGVCVDKVRLLVFKGDLDFRTTAEVEVHHFDQLQSVFAVFCTIVVLAGRACIYTGTDIELRE